MTHSVKSSRQVKSFEKNNVHVLYTHSKTYQQLPVPSTSTTVNMVRRYFIIYQVISLWRVVCLKKLWIKLTLTMYFKIKCSTMKEVELSGFLCTCNEMLWSVMQIFERTWKDFVLILPINFIFQHQFNINLRMYYIVFWGSIYLCTYLFKELYCKIAFKSSRSHFYTRKGYHSLPIYSKTRQNLTISLPHLFLLHVFWGNSLFQN